MSWPRLAFRLARLGQDLHLVLHVLGKTVIYPDKFKKRHDHSSELILVKNLQLNVCSTDIDLPLNPGKNQKIKAKKEGSCYNIEYK